MLLPWGRNPRHTFENFCGDRNTSALAALDEVLQKGGVLWLCGVPGSGKTHLLQAICQRAESTHQTMAYLPLTRNRELQPQVLSGLEQYAWVCLDDVDQVLGSSEWEQLLFALFNQVVDRHASLILTAQLPADKLTTRLPDLHSRLCGAMSFVLQPLPDEQQFEALRQRASSQGYDLPEEVVLYLQRHAVRGLGPLCRELDRLEDTALRRKRRLTVPFVREVLSEGTSG